MAQNYAPGCGGFFMVIRRSPSLVVIDIINVLCVALVKTKDHPPVSPNGHSQNAFPLALKRAPRRPVSLPESFGPAVTCPSS